MRRWILLAVAIDALLSLGGGYLLRKGRIGKLEQTPANYQFLLFPGKGTRIYQTKNTEDRSPVGTLERAILASYKEVKEGVVLVVLPSGGCAFARMEDLAFASDRSDWYVSRTKRALPIGYCTGLHYSVSKVDGAYESRLTVDDDRHIRSYTYRYVTDGRRITAVYGPELRHGIVMSAQFFLFVGGLFLIFAVAGVVGLIQKQQKKRKREAQPSHAAGCEGAAADLQR